MLDIPGLPLLDKERLIGECVRLRKRIDAPRLRREIDAIPQDLWGGTGGRVGVHKNAEALFLRGFAPADGDLPIEDRPVLDRLPYLRLIIGTLIEAAPMRCLLARLPAATSIPIHVDQPPYFGKTLRIHVPVVTNSSVFMLAGASAYCMQPGEIWVLNNSAEHGVINAHPALSRIHVICDFLPSLPLLQWLADGERGLGLNDRDPAFRLSAPA